MLSIGLQRAAVPKQSMSQTCLPLYSKRCAGYDIQDTVLCHN